MFDYRPMDTLTRTAAPLLVLVAGAGTADDDTTRERELALDDILVARRAAGLPAARVVRLPGTGHNLMRYRPDEVSAGPVDAQRRRRALGCDACLTSSSSSSSCSSP